MAEGGDRPGGPRGPLLYAVFALVGIVAAIAFATLSGGGSQLPVTALGSPSAPTTSLDPSTAVVGSLPPPTASLPGSSDEPSAGPTVAPTGTPTPTKTPTPTPSKTPKPTPKPTPTPNTNPAIVSFKVPATEDCTGGTAGSIAISWTIARATGAQLSIDGGLFSTYDGTSQSVDIPFGCDPDKLSHTYTLTTVGGNGPPASITKTVKTAAPTITTFKLGRPQCSSASGYVAISLTYAFSAATGAELTIDGAIYSTYTSKKSSNGLTVNYDCSKDKQTFVFTTTGGYGKEATRSLDVKKP